MEKFDERRVNLLKSQVIQLERQVRGAFTLNLRCMLIMKLYSFQRWPSKMHLKLLILLRVPRLHII